MFEVESCAFIGWPPTVPLTEAGLEERVPPRQAAHANSKTTKICFCMVFLAS
jgi:hypothetical protein